MISKKTVLIHLLYQLASFCSCLVCVQVISNSDPEPPAWSFNLSHQGDYAVLAAEQGLQVGVDIMKTTMPGKY